MKKERQSDNIKIAILSELDKGERNKKIIWDNVVQDLGVPRPTVRRCSRELVEELIQKFKVLTAEWKRPGK